MRWRWWCWGGLLLVGCRQILGVDSKEFPEDTGASGSGPAVVDDRELYVLDTINAFATSREIFFKERRPVLLDALRASPADVLCLQEVSHGAERDMLAADLSEAFPHAALFHTDEGTPVDSPADITGEFPGPLAPPCKGFDEEVALFSSCAKEHCSTLPGSGDGLLTSEACFVEKCWKDVFSVLGSVEQKICARCIRNGAPTMTIHEIEERCRQSPGIPLWMNGDIDTLLLSRHPIQQAIRWVLPSTNNRKAVIFARVEKPGLPPLDVYCTRLGTIHDGVYDVYYGSYGEGFQGQKAWETEQKLQAIKTVEFMNGPSKNRRAVLVGWMGASRLVSEGGKTVIEGSGEPALTVLDGFLQSASSPSQDRVCTGCRSNPIYNLSFLDQRPDHAFLFGFDPGAVVSLDRVYDDASVEVTPSSSSKGKDHIPISDGYGLRLRLRVSP